MNRPEGSPSPLNGERAGVRGAAVRLVFGFVDTRRAAADSDDLRFLRHHSSTTIQLPRILFAFRVRSMMISDSEAKTLTDKVLSLSKADSCVVSLSGYKRRHLRFALN